MYPPLSIYRSKKMDFNPVRNNQNNPLTAYMRQPKIYIRLPSQGQFWPTGSLENTATGEFPVYSMTAKDELLLKVPDALLNGQAVVDVIQSCVPNIKDAWKMPSLDVDVVLLGMRIATYGEMMTTPVKLENGEEYEYSTDLRKVMDDLMSSIHWDQILPINNEMTIYLRPLTYKSITDAAIKTFETQRMLQTVNEDKISDEEKSRLFKDSFNKLSAATIGTLNTCIYKIDTPAGSVENALFIREFVDNMDKSIFDAVQKHLTRLQEGNSIKPIKITVTDDMRAKGATGDTIEIPITFDPSTFFA